MFVKSVRQCCLGLFALAIILMSPLAYADEPRIFRIGTGGIGGTYYPIGGIIASAISSPPGARPCDKGGSCGVPGLVAIAQTSDGSVANVEAVANGSFESGFVQSDIAHWAYSGTGTFRKRKAQKSIRAIANLYPESFHVVVRDGSKIGAIRDLKGRRVSLDEKGSGALVDARLVLRAFGLRERRDFKPRYLKGDVASAQLVAGKLDAFIIVAGYPVPSVVHAVEKGNARLLHLSGKPVDALVKKHKYFSRDMISVGAYGNSAPIPTVSVNALWIANETVDEELVYQITKALWNENSRKLLDEGHQKGKRIQLSTALKGISIPLHLGAKRFYKEVGLVDD